MDLGGVLFLSSGSFLADVNWRMLFLIDLLALLIFPLMVLVLPAAMEAIALRLG